MVRGPQFDASVEPFKNFSERLEAFFTLNGTSDKKKVSSLVVFFGPEMYKTLKNLLVPDSPKTKSFDELVEVLKNHYSPACLEVAQRHKFHSRSQKPAQSLKDYSSALKQLPTNCKFGNFLQEALRDRLVACLMDKTMVRKLLSELDLTLQRAGKLVLDMDVVKQQSEMIKEEDSDECSVLAAYDMWNKQERKGLPEEKKNQWKKKQRNYSLKNQPSSPCDRCGRTAHTRENWLAAEW